MKKILLTALILMVAVTAYSADEFAKVETRKDVSKYVMKTVQFSLDAPQCDVLFQRVDEDGNTAGGNVVVTFANIPAVIENQCAEPVCSGEPEVCEDPVCEDVEITPANPEFNLLVQAINAGSDIKQTIINGVKLKLGL